MTLFWILAGALALGAALLLIVPALRSNATGRRAPLSVAGACVVALAVAIALYLRLSNWNWQAVAPDAQQSIHELNALRRAVDASPQDAMAWIRLGAAYARLEQYPAAQRAYDRANRIAPGRSAAALAGLAETLILGGAASGKVEPAVNARASELFEQALVLEPDNGKALFYSALVALQDGNPVRARERFVALRRGDLPPEIAATLDRQIAALDAQLQPQAVDTATAIRLSVRVSDSLRAKLPAQAQLFVFVRGATGGPPLAVKRLAAALPAELTLSAADSMLAGNGLKPGQKVTVVARVSAGGGPVAQSGDPFGELQTSAGAAGVHVLVIDRVTP